MTPPRRPRRAARETWLDRNWKWVTRFLGAGILAWQTVIEHVDRPSLIVAAVGLMTADQLIKLDRRRRGD